MGRLRDQPVDVLLVPRPGHRERAPNVVNEPADLLLEGLVRDGPQDHPGRLGLGRRDQLAAEGQVLEQRGGDPAVEQVGRPRFRHADLPLGKPEPGALRRDGDVGAHGDDQSTADAHAVDGGDDDLRAVPDRVERKIVGEPVHRQGIGARRGDVEALPQVAAGGKRPSPAGDDDRVHVTVGLGHPDGVAQLPVQRRREGVEGVGPVEDDPRRAALDLVGQFREVVNDHSSSSSRTSMSPRSG